MFRWENWGTIHGHRVVSGRAEIRSQIFECRIWGPNHSAGDRLRKREVPAEVKQSISSSTAVEVITGGGRWHTQQRGPQRTKQTMKQSHDEKQSHVLKMGKYRRSEISHSLTHTPSFPLWPNSIHANVMYVLSLNPLSSTMRHFTHVETKAWRYSGTCPR